MAQNQSIPSRTFLNSDAGRVHLEALFAHFAKLDQRLTCIQKQRDQVRSIIDEYRALLVSPVCRLPFEILQEIFIQCLPTERNAVMSVREAPLLLGRVCSAWRNVSMSTPRLWASIHIPIPCPLIGGAAPESMKAATARNELVKAWLERSGSCPLSISLAEIFTDHTSAEFHLVSSAGADVMAILAQHARRWKHVEVSCAGSAFQTLMAVSGNDVPLLESLSLRSLQGRQKNYSKSIFLAPRLHTIRLSQMPGDIFDYKLHWSNITELLIESHGTPAKEEPYVFHKLSASQALELLSSCHNLVRCTLDINTRDESALAQETLQPIYLPSLIELCITEGLGFLGPFFDCLHTAGLTSFKFATSLKRLDHMFSPSTFLSRLSTLETLTLEISNLSQTHIIECLQRTQSIRSLTLMITSRGEGHFIYQDDKWELPRAECDDSLLNRFIPVEETPDTCICPGLRSFECNWNSFTDETLERFIRSRTGSRIKDANNEGLTRVAVSFYRARTVDLKSRLSATIASGLELSLDYPPAVSVSAWQGSEWNNVE